VADRDRTEPSDHPSPPKEKYRKIRLFLGIVVDDLRIETEIHLGNRRKERLTALLAYVSSHSAGVPIEDATKFLMREFFSSRDLAGKDLRDLEYSGLLRKQGDHLFAVQEDERRE